MTIVITFVASFFATLFFYAIQRYATSILYNIFSLITSKQLDHYHTDLESVTSAYENYSILSRQEIDHMWRSYGSISRQHKRIGFELGYTHKLNTLQDTIQVNAAVTQAIARLARRDFNLSSWVCGESVQNGSQQLGRMREVLKHFVRDWSQEGAEERSKTFPVILNELSRVPYRERKDKTVLVPGAGLARLPWEIAALGFNTTSNEMSPYMNLAFRFLVSRSTTFRCHQHTIHPFAHWFSHQRSNDSLFRAITFPDTLPALAPISRLRHEEADFLKLPSINGCYDYIVTHYFIDTSHNIISTLQKIHSLLRQGGIWLNLGPLLWMSGGQATLELSLEEVLELSEIVGLKIRKGSNKKIPSQYTQDKGAMTQWIYEAEFWIAFKG